MGDCMASESDPTATPEQSARRFYSELERLLKHHQPIEFASFAVDRLREADEERASNVEKWTQTPHHRVIHAIEANCAFFRHHYHEPVTLQKLFSVMNVYHDLEPTDLLARYLDQHHLDLAFMNLHRQQIEFQTEYGKADLAKAWSLFVEGNPCPKLSESFASRFGLSMKEWMRIAFVTYAVANGQSRNKFRSDQLLHPSLGLRPAAVEAFIREATWTPEELGEAFREARQNIPVQHHSFIRSAFWERPLINLGDGRLLAPVANLLAAFAGEGLYRRMLQLGPFHDEFSASFEAYVERFLPFLSDAPKVIGAKRLKRELAPSKSCDFLVELPTEILLVECKATRFTKRLLTPTVIAEDTAIRKIADGFHQVLVTSRDTAAGRLESLAVSKNKPMVGIVVTYGDIPFVNSDWCTSEILAPLLKNKWTEEGTGGSMMVAPPTTMSVATFELLVVACRHLNTSVRQILADRSSQRFIQSGDWGPYLAIA